MASRAAPAPGTVTSLEPKIEGMGTPGYAGHRPRDLHEETAKRMDYDRGAAIPGYGGHRPRGSRWGGKSEFSPPRVRGYPSPAKERPKSSSPTKMHKKHEPRSSTPPPSYRQQMNGIVPGYTGHMPRDQFKTGRSSFGNLPENGAKSMSPQGHKSLSGGVAGGLHPFEGVRPHPQHSFVTRPAGAIFMADFVEGYTGHVPSRGPWEKGMVIKVEGNPHRGKPSGWAT